MVGICFNVGIFGVQWHKLLNIEPCINFSAQFLI